MKKELGWMMILLLFIIPTITTDAARINEKSLTLSVGESERLSIIGSKKSVKWSSSNKAVATVGKYGKVKAKSVGKAVITGKIEDKEYKFKVTVKTRLDAESAYMQYMEDNYQKWSKPLGYKGSFPFYYTFYDIDIDGEKEMFVRREFGAKGGFEVYGFDGEKVYLLTCVGGGWACVRPGFNEILIGCGTGWSSYYTIYKKEGNRFVSLYTLAEEHWQGKDAYRYNGFVTTKNNFDEYKKQYSQKIEPDNEFIK